MSDLVTVENIKDALAHGECPICTEYFHDPSRIPRRMPCCSQAICQPCLETYSKGRPRLSCPLCRQQHHLPGGVKSLPKEIIVLRFLEVLKTKKDAVPTCTDCPDNNPAMAKCDNCSIYLCRPCLDAHARNRISRNHKTITFEEIKQIRSTRSSSTAPQTRPGDVHLKLDNIRRRLDTLTAITKNVDQSKKTASNHINVAFDDLIGELQQRRGILLSLVDSKADEETKSVTRVVESHKTLQEKLQKIIKGQLPPGLHQILIDECPEDVHYDRKGINFLDVNLKEATSIIKSIGEIRTITFTPAGRPDGIAETGPCSIVTFENANISPVTSVFLKEVGPSGDVTDSTCSLLDQVLILENKQIFCPHLELDHSTSSDNLISSGSGITNTGPAPHLANTGCRLRRNRAAFLSKPFVFEKDQRMMYVVKGSFKVKQAIPPEKYIWSMTSSAYPRDVKGTQNDGFFIEIGTYDDEGTIYLTVRSKVRLFCEPFLQNVPGASGDLHLAVVLDSGDKTIHVIDVADAFRLTTVSDVDFDSPLWTMISLGRPSHTEETTDIVSGNNIQVSKDVLQLLNTL